MFRTVPFRPSAFALALAAVAATALTLSSAVYATQTYNESHSNTANQIVAHKPCNSPNSTHGTPFSLPSCSPPQENSPFLTVAPPNKNGKLKSIGSVRHDPISGDPSTPQNEADIAITVKLTDVRCRGIFAAGLCDTANTDIAGRPDYSGQVLAITTIRITDNNNGPTGSDPATVIDFPFRVPVDCTATLDTALGSTCAIATTANTLVPGAVVEGRNTAWELAGTQVQDGGHGGSAGAPDASLFETEGIWLR